MAEPVSEASSSEGSPDGSLEGAEYLIVRGEVRPRTVGHRKVVPAPGAVRRLESPPKPTRVIAHSANFGHLPRRFRRGVVEDAAPPALDLAHPVAVSAALAAPRQRRGALLALGLVGGALVLLPTLMVLWPRASVAPSAVETSVSAVQDMPVYQGEVSVDVIRLVPLADGGAVALYGQITNGTEQVQSNIEIEASLVQSGVATRRREVPCCDVIGPADAEDIAYDRQNQHFHPENRTSPPVRVAPGAVQDFTVIFRGVALAPGAALPDGQVRLIHAGAESAALSPPSAIVTSR